MEKVLVTGATGFIGLHCLSQLLDAGYAVRGTVRDLARTDEVRTAMEKAGSPVAQLRWWLRTFFPTTAGTTR